MENESPKPATDSASDIGGAIEGLKPKPNFWTFLRNWFVTGIVVSAPIGITIWLIWSFVSFVDKRIKPLIPREWNPETYLRFALPGLGIVVAVVGLTLIGALTANLVGREFLRLGERLVKRVPVVHPLYSILKQVFETFAKSDATTFKEAVLLEYPRKGIWSIGFITNQHPGGEIAQKVHNVIAVFVPTVPNPSTGFLLYVPREEVQPLRTPVDKVLKQIFSIGILSPDQLASEPAATGKVITQPSTVAD
ncbi:MAG: DUF502 domain-containing protein [Hyphomonadaceae bacterium]